MDKDLVQGGPATAGGIACYAADESAAAAVCIALGCIVLPQVEQNSVAGVITGRREADSRGAVSLVTLRGNPFVAFGLLTDRKGVEDEAVAFQETAPVQDAVGWISERG